MSIYQDKRLTLGLLLIYFAAFAIAVPGRWGVHASEPLISVCRDDSVGECVSVRGGSDNNDGAEGKITQFLSVKKLSLDNFHIHGWRWHTMSLVREAGRLKKLAERSNCNGACDHLKHASEYVVGFNLKGLHKIEADLFFPWMRKKLTEIQQKDLASAFGSVMDRLESDRKKVAQLGESIVSCFGEEMQEPVN
jgi:hypothetical protein